MVRRRQRIRFDALPEDAGDRLASREAGPEQAYEQMNLDPEIQARARRPARRLPRRGRAVRPRAAVLRRDRRHARHQGRDGALAHPPRPGAAARGAGPPRSRRASGRAESDEASRRSRADARAAPVRRGGRRLRRRRPDRACPRAGAPAHRRLPRVQPRRRRAARGRLGAARRARAGAADAACSTGCATCPSTTPIQHVPTDVDEHGTADVRHVRRTGGRVRRRPARPPARAATGTVALDRRLASPSSGALAGAGRGRQRLDQPTRRTRASRRTCCRPSCPAVASRRTSGRYAICAEYPAQARHGRARDEADSITTAGEGVRSSVSDDDGRHAATDGSTR